MNNTEDTEIPVWWFIGGVVVGSLGALFIVYVWLIKNIKW